MLTKRRRQQKQQKKKAKKKKKTVGLIGKKKKFTRAAHFFCTFLCRCFAQGQHETSINFLVTRFMEEMLYVVLFTFFAAAHIYLSGR